MLEMWADYRLYRRYGIRRREILRLLGSDLATLFNRYFVCPENGHEWGQKMSGRLCGRCGTFESV